MMFKVGDKVKIKDCLDGWYAGKIGEICLVDIDDEDAPYRVNFPDDAKLWLSEDVLELIESAEEEPTTSEMETVEEEQLKFKVGDRVRIVDCPIRSHIGEEGVIEYVNDADSTYTYRADFADIYFDDWFEEKDLELIEPATTSKMETVEKPKFKVGDRVRTNGSFYDYLVGDVGTISTFVDGYDAPYKIFFDNYGLAFLREEDLELVESANTSELAISKTETTTKSEEEPEFKVGDEVEIVAGDYAGYIGKLTKKGKTITNTPLWDIYLAGTDVNLSDYKENEFVLCSDYEEDKKEVISEMETTTSEPTIKDSGDRTEYSTGAVRDMKEGKGRCDLMPLDVLWEIVVGQEGYSSDVLLNIGRFKSEATTGYLYVAIREFAKEENKTFWDLFLELAKHFEEGAKKYGENNWQKGIPVHSYIDSAIRHYLKHKAGWKDEPHDRAFVWNIVCGAWTMIHRPELDDFTDREKDNDISDN